MIAKVFVFAGPQPEQQQASTRSAAIAEPQKAEQNRTSAASDGSNQAAAMVRLPPSASAAAANLGDGGTVSGSAAVLPAAGTTRQLANGDAEQSPVQRSWGALSPGSNRSAVQLGKLGSPHQADGSPAAVATSPGARPPQSPPTQVSSDLYPSQCHASGGTDIHANGVALR